MVCIYFYFQVISRGVGSDDAQALLALRWSNGKSQTPCIAHPFKDLSKPCAWCAQTEACPRFNSRRFSPQRRRFSTSAGPPRTLRGPSAGLHAHRIGRVQYAVFYPLVYTLLPLHKPEKKDYEQRKAPCRVKPKPKLAQVGLAISSRAFSLSNFTRTFFCASFFGVAKRWVGRSSSRPGDEMIRSMFHK